MAKQQNVIDATIDLIKGGKDASEVLKCCKCLVKDDLFLLIGLLSSLKTLKTIEEDKDDNDTTQDANKEKVDVVSVKLDENVATTANTNTDTDNDADAAKKKVAEDQKEAEKEAEKRKAKIKCRYFLKFGSSDKNDKGCKNGSKCLSRVVVRTESVVHII
jgi:prolyl-tRNA synthetase